MYQRPSDKYSYSTYQYICNRPEGYHRYQSNLCDPTQDHLPITMPNPNEGITEQQINSYSEYLISKLKYGTDYCQKCKSCKNCECQEY